MTYMYGPEPFALPINLKLIKSVDFGMKHITVYTIFHV